VGPMCYNNITPVDSVGLMCYNYITPVDSVGLINHLLDHGPFADSSTIF
jgi:hypothetical protein